MDQASRIRIPRDKVVRTVLYGDVLVSEWELKLIHTPIMQRLYDLKQLGFADRVYPDAIHSRFNHSLGCVEVTERILKSLGDFLPGRNRKASASNKTKLVPFPTTLEADLEGSADSLRLAALLHDITHIPFGHTLEDEVCIFKDGHENPRRQLQFFNRLTYEFLSGLHQSISPAALFVPHQSDYADERAQAKALFQELKRQAGLPTYHCLSDFESFCKRLRDAFLLLLNMHSTPQDHEASKASSFQQEIDTCAAQLYLNEMVGSGKYDSTHDAWKGDVIGNTICADLLDYARRDIHFSGLVSAFDDRIYRYFELQKVADQTRVVIKIFSNKIRLDVLSEILNVLKIRYLLSERVLFHPTKCAAGAMLGRAASLLDKTSYEEMYASMGDRELLVRWKTEAEDRLRACDRILSFLDPSRPSSALPVVRAFRKDTLQTWLGTLQDEWNSRYASQIPDSKLSQEALPFNPSSKDARARFVRRLLGLAKREPVRFALQDLMSDHAQKAAGAARLIDGLLSRQFYKPVYQITRQAAEAHRMTSDSIAEKYCDPDARSALESRLEKRLALPVGSIAIHCPRRKTTLKEARVLVAWSSTEEAMPFNKLDIPALRAFKDESDSIEEKYKEIWSMYVFIPESLLPFFRLIQKAVQDEIVVENSQLLQSLLLEDARAAQLSDQIGRVEDVHLRAMVKTFSATSEALASAARHGKYPDVIEGYKNALSELIEDEKKH